MYFSENNINKIFQNGYLLYQGYVDDPRNTDNSWMETQGKFSSSRTSGSFTLIVKFLGYELGRLPGKLIHQKIMRTYSIMNGPKI